MKVQLILVGLVTILILGNVDCGRRGGGGSRSSSSSGGWFGSGRKSSSSSSSSSSGSGWSSWGSKKKTNTNPQSSYPKQQYGNTGTGSSYPKQNYGTGTGSQSNVGTGQNIGGGGWSNTNTGNRGYGTNTNNVGGGGWSNTGTQNRNYGSNNYGGNYGGNNIGGGGWVNRNQYYQNRGNIYSGTNYNSFGYGYGRQNYGYYGSNLFSNHYRTTGGLFGGGKRSFALGAGAGFLGGAMAGVAAMSMYHQYKMYQTMLMYNMMGGGYHGYSYGHNPYGYGGGRRGMLLDEFDCMGGCPNQAFCDYGICRCRSGYDARYGQCWNRMDDFNRRQNDWDQRQQANFDPYRSCISHKDCRDTVDMNMICKEGKCACRDDMKWNSEGLECQIYIDVNCTDVKTEKIVEVDTNSTIVDDNDDDEDLKYDDSFVYNLTDPTTGQLNITEISADETLASSELSSLDPNATKPEDMRQAFCRDMARVARSYEQNLVIPENNGRNSGSESSMGTGTIILIIILVIGSITLFCYCTNKAKIKEKFQNNRSNDDYNMDNNYQYDDNQRAPEYPPMQPPQNLYPQMPPADPGLPPLGPAIPPTQPGYGHNPDPANPYPPAPVGGGVPYPPAPGGPAGAVPYPPAAPTDPPPYSAAPYPPAPYPPQGAPYPPQPAYNPNA